MTDIFISYKREDETCEARRSSSEVHLFQAQRGA